MTVSTLTSRVSYPGAGSTGPFAIPFRFLTNADLVVTKRSAAGVETTLILTTHYTLTGAGEATGTLTLVSALAAGETLVIRRAPAVTQPTSIRNQGAYYPATIEDEFDRLAMQLQGLKDELSRSFGVSETYDPSTLSVRLKPETGKVLAWQSATELGNSTLASSAVALPGGGRTVATLSAYLANNAVLNVMDFGATGAGAATDDTAEMQAAISAGVTGSRIFVPNPPVLYKITDSLLLPLLSGYSVEGQGRQSSRIVQYTAGKHGLDTNLTWPNVNDLAISDLWLDTSGLAPAAAGYGIKLQASSRSKIEDVLVSTWLAGVYLNDVIIVTLKRVQFNGCQDGILTGPGLNTALNALLIAECLFESQTRYAINLGSFSNVSIRYCTIETNAKGGINVVAGYAIAIEENYFEANEDGTAGTFDIKLSISVGLKSGTIKNNFFASSVNANHYPLRLDHLNGVVVEANHVNTGSRFIYFGSYDIYNCRFGKLTLGTGTRDRTQGTQATYGNIHPLFIHNGNIMEDYETFPCDGENYTQGEFPYGNWTFGGSGTATFARSPNTGAVPDVHSGRPVLRVNQTAGVQAFVKQDIAISAALNNRMRGKWITFLLDVYVNNGVAKGFDLYLNATVGTSAQLSYVQSSADGWATYSVCVYVSTTETQISPFFVATSVAEYWIANARVYVGMDPRTMPLNTGAPFWSATAAPAAGTWAVGDRVAQKTPAVGSPKGWMCTVAGTPGTWVSEGNL